MDRCDESVFASADEQQAASIDLIPRPLHVDNRGLSQRDGCSPAFVLRRDHTDGPSRSNVSGPTSSTSNSATSVHLTSSPERPRTSQTEQQTQPDHHTASRPIAKLLPSQPQNATVTTFAPIVLARDYDFDERSEICPRRSRRPCTHRLMEVNLWRSQAAQFDAPYHVFLESLLRRFARYQPGGTPLRRAVFTLLPAWVEEDMEASIKPNGAFGFPPPHEDA